jgi:hypothetical protein
VNTRLRLLVPLLAVSVALAACGGAASPTPDATDTPATAAPTASPVPAESSGPGAICDDAAAFRASVAALSELRLVEVGTNGVREAVDEVRSSGEALLASGRDLVGPPVAELLAAVTALQATLTGLGDQPSLGAGLVAVRAAIAEIRSAADDVEAALRTSCPTQ